MPAPPPDVRNNPFAGAGSFAGLAGGLSTAGAALFINTQIGVVLNALGGTQVFDVPKEELGPDWVAQSDHFYIGEGLNDTNGTITSGAGDDIRKPSDLIQYLLYAYQGEALSNFYASGFGSTADFNTEIDNLWETHLGAAGYGFFTPKANYRVVVTNRVSAGRVLRQLITNMPGAAMYRDEDGKWRLIVRMLEPDITDSARYYGQVNVANQCVGDTFRPVHGSFRNLITKIAISYDFNYMTGQFQRRAVCEPGQSDDGYGKAWGPVFQQTSTLARTLLGEAEALVGDNISRTREITAGWVTEPAGAVAIGNHIAAFEARPVSFIQFEALPSLYDLLPGQYVNFRTDSIPSKIDWFPYNVSTGSNDTPWVDNLWMVRLKELLPPLPPNQCLRYRYTLELAPQTIGTGAGAGMHIGAPMRKKGRGRRATMGI